MTQCATLTTHTAQMVATGKVHNRLKRGSCDSEREAGRNTVQRLETTKCDTGSQWIYCLIKRSNIKEKYPSEMLEFGHMPNLKISVNICNKDMNHS